MSPKKSKRSFNKKIEDEINKLTRPPLYPDLSEEKENMKFVSSDDSPEKLSYNCSPRMTRKSNSPSSTDSMEDTPGIPKRRNENQINNFHDNEYSDVEMEIDNYEDTDYHHDNICNQEQEQSEISQGTKFKKPVSPKEVRKGNSTETTRKRFYKPEAASPRKEPSASASNSENSAYLFFIIPFICFLIFFMYWIRYPSTSNMNDQFNASTLVKSLKSEFQDQPSLTFRIIHSALKNVLEVPTDAPAIILLIAANGSEIVCSEFALKLVDLLAVTEYTVKISGKDYKQANTNHAKLTIDKAILKTLKTDQLGVVLIENLDQIPGQAAMILHKYSDHENAPFKRAVFVMTVNYNKAISDYSNTKVWDKTANDHLLSVWTDIGVDQVIPLLARLTVSVAVLKV